MSNCRLCLNREADKENSHIIPKFLAKRLFESTKPRHSIKIDRQGGNRKIQDSPKESYIFCKVCEKRFEYLETRFSKKITSINNHNNLKDRFKTYQIGPNKVIECLNINPVGFKVFIFSLVWRASISELPDFETFKLEEKTETELRAFLDKTLKNSHSELVDSISKVTEIPNYDYCIFKPLVRNQFTRGIFTSYRVDEFIFGLFTVDFIIYFFPNTKNLKPAFEMTSNKQNEKLLITLAGIEDWNHLNEIVVRKMLKKL